MGEKLGYSSFCSEFVLEGRANRIVFDFNEMQGNRIYLVLIFLIICGNADGQSSELREIDQMLANSYQTMMLAESQLRSDSLAPSFQQLLLAQLENPLTFENSLDSLSKYITVKMSKDRQLKFYSWDEHHWGTWHTINCIAQFMSSGGKVMVQPVSSGIECETGDFTDCVIYQVDEIHSGPATFYVTFGWGTHGAGHQHQIVQVFQLVGDALEKCTTCFADKADLVIEYPRACKADLTFEHRRNCIRFDEFIYDENDGFHKPSGKKIVLEFREGVFVKK